jgi:NADPH:quinone reductase-like Zn-dependent oxidoreductase
MQPAGTTMKAVVLDGPGPPSALRVRQVPRPHPQRGWVLISVRAFGLNRLGLYMRLGLSEGVTFPRIPGVEAVGVVAECPGGEFSAGQQVATLMGGMGRVFDGGSAEYCCVPAAQVVPFHSDLDWTILGAIPEMLQTANGSLTVGLDAKEDQSLLIRGGTSSVGMATAVLAKRLGMRVLSTTRHEGKAPTLRDIGVDEVILDDGQVASRVHSMAPGGVAAALELVGSPTLPDTLRSTRMHGVVCFSGMLSNQWIVDKFYPMEYIPRGVRLTAYVGDATDLPSAVFQGFIDEVSEGTAVVPIGEVYQIDQIVEAHTAMEDGKVAGKIVVLT